MISSQKFIFLKGFVPYDIFDGHNHPLNGVRVQVDIAFVKENGSFRSSHIWATAEQEAVIFAYGTKA